MTDNHHPDNLKYNRTDYIITKTDIEATNHYWIQKDTNIFNKLTKKSRTPCTVTKQRDDTYNSYRSQSGVTVYKQFLDDHLGN